MTAKRRSLGVIAVVCCVLLTAACSAPPEGPNTGGGEVDYKQVSDGHLTFLLPKPWVRSSTGTKPFDAAYAGGGMEVRVAGDYSDDGTAYAALARLDLTATFQLTGYKPVHTGKIKVNGAHDAVERSFTYLDGSSTKTGVWIIATQFPYPASAVLTITAPADDVKVMKYIQDSVGFKNYH